MYEFPKHKIILELGEDNDNCLERIEFKFDSQMGLTELMNSVFRPLLIGLGYCNDTISEYFGMNESGEDVDIDEQIEARRKEREETPDIGDGLLDPEEYKDEREADIKEENDIILHDVSSMEDK